MDKINPKDALITEIEKLKDKTYQLHKVEDGIMDMVIGLALLLIGLGQKLHSPVSILFLFLIIAFIPFTVLRLKKKLVYPRVGYVVFSDSREQNRIYKILLYILFFAVGFVFANFFYNAKQMHGSNHPLYYVYCILVSSLFIYGGFTQKHMLYVVGFCFALPLSGYYFIEQTWFGLPISIVINVTFITAVNWLLRHRKPIVSREAARRPNIVIHSYLAGLGVLGLTYFLFLTFFFDFTNLLQIWVVAHFEAVFISFIALIVMGFGIAFKAMRYYLYTGLVCLTIVIIRIPNFKLITSQSLLECIGLLVVAIGAILFIRFLKHYPVLAEKEVVPDEI